MSIHLLPVPVRTPQIVQQQLIASCADVRIAIGEAANVREAYALYESLRGLEREIQHLVNLAGDRCEQLLEKM